MYYIDCVGIELVLVFGYESEIIIEMWGRVGMFFEERFWKFWWLVEDGSLDKVDGFGMM